MADRRPHAFDTSVIVAAMLGWHEHHARALRALQQAFDHDRVLVPGPALIEVFSVMTRLPAPHRISPSDARELLEQTFTAVRVVVLTAQELWRLLRAMPEQHVAGGRVYDAHILACARKAEASVLWTFNERDFETLVEGDEIAIRTPS
jgi:predicted nucleic acid-binding protein